MLAICNSNITSFRDLWIWDVKKLSNIPKAIRTLERLETSPDRLINLRNKLQSINSSIQNYKNSSTIRKIIDFITGYYFKMVYLRQFFHQIVTAINERIEPAIRESKLKTMFQVQERFHVQYSNDESRWDSTTRSVNEYIQGKIIELGTKQKNVPIPRWFHATKQQFWDSIVRSKTIEQRSAPLGHGAFVSTNDESLNQYGPYTFALDDLAVTTYPAAYFSPPYNPRHETYDSLWVRVENDINLSQDTVAHFVIPDNEDRNITGERLLTDLNLEVPVITRSTSRRINELFDEVIKKRLLPSTWRRHEQYRVALLPPNIQES